MKAPKIKLFSYCIPYDDGAAPNPYWGICTLVICKPAIRRAANVGDWIVGTGSKNSPIGDLSGKIVYAMKVTKKMTMAEYDTLVQREYPNKIPAWESSIGERRLGDAIYDFSVEPPRLRRGVHSEMNRVTDLSGQFALISDHFWYFGNRPIALPKSLEVIVKQGQGHRSLQNDPFVPDFVKWIVSLGLPKNSLLGSPQLNVPPAAEHSPCSASRADDL